VEARGVNDDETRMSVLMWRPTLLTGSTGGAAVAACLAGSGTTVGESLTGLTCCQRAAQPTQRIEEHLPSRGSAREQ
jgi:hypothetical protein